MIARAAALQVVILVGLALVPAAAAQPAAQPTDPVAAERAELAGRLIEALAAGEDGAAERQRLAELGPPPSRGVRPAPATEASGLRRALEDLHARLGPPPPADGPAGGPRPLSAAARARPAHLLASYQELQAHDLLMREHFAGVRRRLEDADAGAEAFARLDAAVAAYDEAIGRVLDPLAAPMEELARAEREERDPEPGTEAAARAALAEVAAVLDETLAPPPSRVLRAALPFRRTGLAVRPPVTAPTVVPSYLDPLDAGSDPADLAGSPEAPLTAEIVARAEALDHDYVRIFEFVRNEIATEWYAGGMKGAEETLRQGAGNDVDQASLLIALFRASTLPARYVHGVIERPIGELAAELGLADPGAVPAALARAGVAHRPVIQGGALAAVELEHTWVAAHVPYANYRGAVVDFSGRTWLPLAPALATTTAVPPTRVLRRMELSVDGAIEAALAAPRPLSPLAEVRQQVIDWLAANAPEESYEEQLGERTIDAEVLGLLPSSLPVPVVAVTGEEPALGASHLHTVRWLARAGSDPAAAVVFDAELPLHRLAGRRVTLSYLPATVDDHRTVNAFGGLDSVPVYLVRLRPQLKVDGRTMAVGEGSLPMGAEHRIEVEVAGPWGSERVAEMLFAGTYQALAVSPQRTLPRPDPGGELADTESLAARLLSRLALEHGRRWGEAEDELAALLGVRVMRPLPAVAFVTNEVRLEQVLGLPQALIWEGVTLDAALRAAEPFDSTAEDPAAARDWMRLAALEGSALEHRVFEDELLVESVSADKALGLARQAGTEVVTVDAGNVDAVLPTLLHPPEVLAEIDHWASQGLVIEVPRMPVTLNAWQGSAWRVEEPASGEAGYFLAGGLAGGATTEPPDNWILDFVADALAAPYAGEPNTDPLAGAEIVKVFETDGQQAEVGTVLPLRLAVRVRDETGRPVQGAEVLFSSWSGGGLLLDGSGSASEQLIATTDRRGFAEARLRLGQDTSVDPVFILRDPLDEYATQALIHLVEAVAPSHAGTLTLDQPFTAVGLPGPPETMYRVGAPAGDILGTVATWSDTPLIRVDDRFGNPVSNVPVTFTVGPHSPRDPECTNLAPVVQNARVFDPRPDAVGPAACAVDFPRLTDCGVETFTAKTSSRGAAAGVILGDSSVAAYEVFASSTALPDVSPLRFGYSVVYVEGIGHRCGPLIGLIVRPTPANRLLGIATRAGQALSGPYRHWILTWEPDIQVVSGSGGHPRSRALETGYFSPISPAELAYLVSNGGAATPAAPADEGAWETHLIAGVVPGLNQAQVNVQGYAFWGPFVAGQGCEPGESCHSEVDEAVYAYATVGVSPTIPLLDFWGVLPLVTGVVPTPLVLDDAGRTAEETTVHYAILPSDYVAGKAEVDLLEDGEWVATGQGSSRQGEGVQRIQRGFEFDREREYEARLTLNRGRASTRGLSSVVYSDPAPLPLFQGLIRDVSPPGVVSQDVDLVNQRFCAFSDSFGFTLNQPATVTLEFRLIGGLGADGSPELGPPVVLLDDEFLDEGGHSYTVTPSGLGGADLELPPGTWQWRLTGVSAVDGHEEVREGTVVSRWSERDALPIGHVVVKGVDLWDGHLVVSREDFTVAGRGPDLTFARTYSSAAAGPAGPMGAGWAHTWESRVVVTPCGEAIVIGGEGSGMRFVDDGAGGLRPLKGHHGSLVADVGSGAFDFYTTGGTRYHYGHVFQSEFYLQWVEDPYGNRLTVTYAAEPGAPRPAAVRDAAGRVLRLTYQRALFGLDGEGVVLTRVEGPGGIAVEFVYDGWGNLVGAAREAHGDGSQSRVERYEYAFGPEHGFEERHLLVAVHDEITGAETRYEYEHGAVGFQGNVSVPRAFVRRVIEPEGGETEFAIGIAAAGDLGEVSELETAVTDRRGEATSYTLNRYGSPLAIENPLGNVSEMTWAADDVVMTSRTDGKGTTTAYTYDAHGNLLSETVTVVDFDGQSHAYTASRTYVPPGDFEPPYLKNRPASATDRDGRVTTFEYDAKGSPTRQAVTGTDTAVNHTYFANGDRASTTDSRGNTTHFAYDAYGNPSAVTDPLGATATAEWDVRSRPVRKVDRQGRETLTAYDVLDRPVEKTLPRAAGEPSAPAETLLYDDAGRRLVATDAAGRLTETRFDLEGRPVEVIDAEGASRLFEYDPEGNKTLETSWFDAGTPRFDTTFEYDAAGRLVRRVEPLGRTSEYAYDGAGNLVSETLSDAAVGTTFAPRVTEHVYDALDRRIRTRRLWEGGERTMAARYDGAGNKVLDVDPLGRETAYAFDALNRLVEKVEPEWREGEPRVTRYAYDGDGNLLSETLFDEPANRVRSFAYDGLSRLIRATDAEGAVSHSEYDAEGNKIREIDPRLGVVRHNYDARNRLERTTVHLDRVTDPARQVVTDYAYDAVGNRTENRWPNGNVVQHAYDGLNRLLSTTDSLGPMASFEYDARGLQIAATDANGNVTETDYDALGRAVEQRLPEARTVTTSWDAAGNKLTATDARGHTTTFEYDRLDRLVRTIDPVPFNYETAFTYDLAGNKLTETDRRGHTRSFAYDALDRLVRVTDPEPLSYETTFTYDAAGNLRTETDRRGIVTEHTYDRENRRLTTRRAGLTIETAEYDESGNRRFVTDANGHVTGFEYDERNLLTAENRPLAAITRHTLDDLGDVVQTVDPEGRAMAYAFDRRRRRVAETNGAGETTVHTYDGNGNRTTTTRPEGNAWTYGYDSADRLVEVEDPTAAVTAFAYDANSNLVLQTDANLQATAFAYDELNRRISKTYPGGAVEAMTYDSAGNRLSRTDPEGKLTTYAHDALNRETLRTYPPPAEPTGDDLASIATVFDPNNNPIGITETRTGPTGTRTTTKAYDAFDRLLSVTDPDGKAITYGYDAAGNRTRLTDADGRLTLYAFDELNRPVSVTLPNVGVTTYTYFRDGRLKTVAHPNGTRSTQTYDLAGRIATITNTQGTPGALVSSYAYAYDGNGNRSEQIEINGGPAETTTYADDLADRLLSVAYPDLTVTYTYDPAGNRLTERATPAGGGGLLADKTFTYDARNRLLSVTDAAAPAASATFTWDANGNRTSQTRGEEFTAFLYDPRDQLTEVRRDDTLLEAYRYDYQGLRVRKAGPAGIFRYVYDDQSVLLQTDDAGLTVAKYDYGPDRLLSLAHATEGRQYYLFDGLGSVADLMRPDGAIQARYQYDAWGNPRGGAGSSFNPFGFTGHERDDETGLYYAKARYYDPELGLWLTEDPFQGQLDTPPSLHRYLYAYQNPTVWWDSHGRTNALTSAINWLRETAEEGLSSIDEDSTTEEVVKTGLVAGLLNVAADVTTGFNWVVNTLAIDHLPETKVGQEAKAEFEQAAQKVQRAVNSGVERYVEDPHGTTMAVLELPQRVQVEAVKKALTAASGDQQAQAELVATGVEVGSALLPVSAAGKVRQGGRLVGLVDDMAIPRAGSGARVADDLATGIRPSAVTTKRTPSAIPNQGALESVRVFRVEGSPNTRILIGETGEVVVQGDKTLFLNFGSRARAEEFLAQKLGQGMTDAQVKSFEVPQSFLDDLRSIAVLESEVADFPGRPILVDSTKAPDQFGLRAEQIEELRKRVLAGSGRVE